MAIDGEPARPANVFDLGETDTSSSGHPMPRSQRPSDIWVFPVKFGEQPRCVAPWAEQFYYGLKSMLSSRSAFPFASRIARNASVSSVIFASLA